MPAVTDRALQEQVKATLSIDTFDPNSGWPLTCAAANRAAYGTIQGALLKRGYSVAQVDAWDRLQEYQTDIGLWFAIVRGGLARDYDPKFVVLFDRRAELIDVMISIGGEIPPPEGDAASGGPTASGKLDTTDDTWTRGDADLWPWYAAGFGPTNPPVPRR